MTIRGLAEGANEDRVHTICDLIFRRHRMLRHCMQLHWQSTFFVCSTWCMFSLPTQSAQEVEARDGILSEQRLLIKDKLALTARALTPSRWSRTVACCWKETRPSCFRKKQQGPLAAFWCWVPMAVTRFARHLLGSVAENTLRGSALPTLTVGEQVETSGMALPFKRILYATDLLSRCRAGSTVGLRFREEFLQFA